MVIWLLFDISAEPRLYPSGKQDELPLSPRCSHLRALLPPDAASPGSIGALRLPHYDCANATRRGGKYCTTLTFPFLCVLLSLFVLIA